MEQAFRAKQASKYTCVLSSIRIHTITLKSLETPFCTPEAGINPGAQTRRCHVSMRFFLDPVSTLIVKRLFHFRRETWFEFLFPHRNDALYLIQKARVSHFTTNGLQHPI